MWFNNYSVQSELGRGGMATVFLAHDNKFDTHVAIKVLNKEFVHNDNIRKRFLAESRNMFKMSHPNIVKVTDLIDDGDLVAFVMEYVEGETLKEYLEKKGKLGDEEIRAIFTQMLDGVGYVHEQNLVHRDIKPSNFMIDGKGRVKLMDFGIAKNTDTSAAEYTQTGTGMQMGTPMYMSPEQITETKSVTLQSDIYSLGVVLWQMAAGRKPYDVATLSSFQLQLKIVNDPLTPIQTIWDNIIGKATTKDPQQRYVHCGLLKGDINKTVSLVVGDEEKTILVDSDKKNDLNTILENKVPKSSLLKGSKLDADGNVKYGLVDRKGNWVVQPTYNCLNEFDVHGIAAVEENENWGFIDYNGNQVIPPKFEYVFNFDVGGMAAVSLSSQWGFINLKGHWVIPPTFSWVMSFEPNNVCAAQINEKWGIINRAGQWVIHPIFDNIEKFSNLNLAPAKLNEKWGFINLQGQWIINHQFDDVAGFDSLGMSPAKLNEKWGFINLQGQWIIQPVFNIVNSFDNHGMAIASIYEEYGFIDRRGNWLIEPIYSFLGHFDSDGAAYAQQNYHSGYINREGQWIFSYFGVSTKIDAETYRVEVGKKYGYMKKSGKWFIQPRFDLEVDEQESCDEKVIVPDFNEFHVAEYFSDIPDVYLTEKVSKTKVANLLKNTGVAEQGIEYFLQEELWVSHDNTFWGSGKEGFLISSDGVNIWFVFSKDGTGRSNKITWHKNPLDENGDCITKFTNNCGKLEVTLYNYENKENISHTICFDRKIVEALVSFYDNEIVTRQT